MLPPTRHRLIIAGCFAVAATLWWLGGRWAGLVEAHAGLTLTMTPSSLVVTVGSLLPGAVVALLAAAVAAWAGNPLAGVFVLAGSLAVVAGASGPIDAFLRRADVPGAYLGLAAEALVWHALVLGGVAMVGWVWQRTTARRRPALRPGEPLPPADEPGFEGLIAPLDLHALYACAIAAAVATPLTVVLLRSGEPAQVIGGLLIAFTAGGAVAYTTMPRVRCHLAVLAAPLLVAVGGYLWVYAGYADSAAVLAAWFNIDGSSPRDPRLPAVALALPVFYASAGVTGVAMGIGLGQTIVRARRAV